MAMTPAQRTLRSQLAAHMSWSYTSDRTARTAAGARASDWTRFENEIRAEASALGESVTDAQVQLRAESRRKAYYTRLAAQGLAARRAKQEAG